MSTLEVTIQRRLGTGWPVVAELHRDGSLLPVRSEGRLELASEPGSAVARAYGTALGQALFRDAVRDALVQARSQRDVRVLLFVEAEELKAWRWEWLCAHVDSAIWDFLSLVWTSECSRCSWLLPIRPIQTSGTA